MSSRLELMRAFIVDSYKAKLRFGATDHADMASLIASWLHGLDANCDRTRTVKD